MYQFIKNCSLIKSIRCSSSKLKDLKSFDDPVNVKELMDVFFGCCAKYRKEVPVAPSKLQRGTQLLSVDCY